MNISQVGSLCFMDYETTGIDTTVRTKDRPIQIGCIFTDNKLNRLVEYQNLIKWDSLLEFDLWPKRYQAGFKVHKITLADIKEKGRWPHQVRQDLIEIGKEVQEHLCTKKSCAIMSDAPNFEMFWTEFLFQGKDRDKGFPFYYNAWSVYPTFQIFNVKPLYGQKPHDALDDARLLWKGMIEVFKKAEVLNESKS
jgi:DNA polymerase III epsilon subunit-like protein